MAREPPCAPPISGQADEHVLEELLAVGSHRVLADVPPGRVMGALEDVFEVGPVAAFSPVDVRPELVAGGVKYAGELLLHQLERAGLEGHGVGAGPAEVSHAPPARLVQTGGDTFCHAQVVDGVVEVGVVLVVAEGRVVASEAHSRSSPASAEDSGGE